MEARIAKRDEGRKERHVSSQRYRRQARAMQIRAARITTLVERVDPSRPSSPLGHEEEEDDVAAWRSNVLDMYSSADLRAHVRTMELSDPGLVPKIVKAMMSDERPQAALYAMQALGNLILDGRAPGVVTETSDVGVWLTRHRESPGLACWTYCAGCLSGTLSFQECAQILRGFHYMLPSLTDVVGGRMPFLHAEISYIMCATWAYVLQDVRDKAAFQMLMSTTALARNLTVVLRLSADDDQTMRCGMYVLSTLLHKASEFDVVTGTPLPLVDLCYTIHSCIRYRTRSRNLVLVALSCLRCLLQWYDGMPQVIRFTKGVALVPTLCTLLLEPDAQVRDQALYILYIVVHYATLCDSEDWTLTLIECGCIRNLKAVLEAGGASMEIAMDIVQRLMALAPRFVEEELRSVGAKAFEAGLELDDRTRSFRKSVVDMLRAQSETA